MHPGYGFLAENASFAKACEDAGRLFIGPSAASIALMGSKMEARRAAAKYGVRIVPGTLDPVQSTKEARRVAESIGYPIMLKASGGGGGKGLRFVRPQRNWTARFGIHERNQMRLSETMPFILKNSSKDRGISKYRSWRTVTATRFTSASANARFNDGIKRSSKNVLLRSWTPTFAAEWAKRL